jgi:hypothetical protein
VTVAIPTGVGGFAGIKAETTYGTAVVTDQFVEVTKASIKKVKNTATGQGIASGLLVARGARRVVVSQAATGTVDFDVVTNSMGRFLNLLMGGTVTPTLISGTSYTSTFPIADSTGKFATVQMGIPDSGGTIRAYTSRGTKVTGATFSCGIDSLLTATFAVDGQQIDQTITAASPSYVAGATPFHFGQSALKLGTFGAEASVSDVRSVQVQITRPHKLDRFYMGSQVAQVAVKGEPILNAVAAITTTIQVDLSPASKTAFFDRYMADTPTSMVWQFVGPVVSGANNATFQVNLPEVFFDTDSPTLESPDVVTVQMTGTCLYDNTNLPTISTISSDAAL